MQDRTKSVMATIIAATLPRRVDAARKQQTQKSEYLPPKVVRQLFYDALA
jgi:hypothetical protein